MKKAFTLLYIICAFYAKSQVFNGSGGVIQNTGTETNFGLTVSGLSPANIDSTFGIDEVNFDISHGDITELYVYLKSPSGTIIELTNGNSCKGANYTGTKLRADAGTSISQGTAPYTGTFRPIGYLGRFNTGKPGNGTWTLIVKDWNFQGLSGSLTSWSIKFSSAPPKPVILKSSNLPIVIINTNNQVVNDVTDVIVNFGVIYNGGARNNITDPQNNYSGKANFHIRGSSSKNFEKKSFKVELCDNSGGIPVNAPLAGMPSESDWVLNASYADKTLIRNPLTHHLFTQMGHYSPRTQLVEVIYNGEYFGVYALMEQPKRGADRIDIAKMTPIDNAFPDITGGYIIQINRSDDPGWYSLFPGISTLNPPSKFYYQYNYPRAEEISPQQKNYIKSVLDTFETVMSSSSFNDPKVGYNRFIDLDAFVDFLILNEFSKNPDAYKLSTYLYKNKANKGGKIFIGPMWDYDIAWHNCDYGNTFDDKYWQFEQTNGIEPIPTWWKTFMTDKNFTDRVYCRWKTFRKEVLSESAIEAYVANMATKLGESQARNFKQFPIIGARVFPNPQAQAGATYATEIQDLKNWLKNRAAWIDANIPGFCATVGFEEVASGVNELRAYPNPFSGELTLKYKTLEFSKVNIELFNLIGERVYQSGVANKPKGEYEETLTSLNLPAGTYVIKVTMNNTEYNKKLIKLNN